MRVAVYVFDGITMFHMAAPMMVFGEVERLGYSPAWETRLWSDRAGSVRTVEGYPIGEVAGPETTEWADIVVVPSWPQSLEPVGPALGTSITAAHARGAVVAGLCLGAFAVADLGLLHGRAAVTHWAAMPILADRSVCSTVDATSLYIDHGDVMTSAGTASAIDACLHLVRARLGSAVAARIARSLVVAPHREGGQAQYIERPLSHPAADTTMRDVQEWALGHLDEPLGVEALAARARMSRRSFVRHFRQSTGTTPARWVLRCRLDNVRTLLETTDWTVEAVASRSGFGSAVTLRQRFAAEYGVTPTAHRRQFAQREQPWLSDEAPRQ